MELWVEGSIRTPLSRWLHAGTVPCDERRDAGIIGGALWGLCGITTALFAALPRVSHGHAAALIVLGMLAVAWGVCSILLFDWRRASSGLIHVSTCAALIAIAVGLVLSGGFESPSWLYLFFVAVFAGYFYSRRVAYAYLAGCVAVQLLPFVYQRQAWHDEYIAESVIAITAYLVIGGAIVIGKHRMWRLRRRAERLAAEQGALRRVATAVVGSEPAESIYELVSREAAGLLGGHAAGVLRIESPEMTTVVGSWSDHLGGRYVPGTEVPIGPGNDIEQVIRSGRPLHIDCHEAGSGARQLGHGSSILTPIHVVTGLWGVLAVSAAESNRFSEADEKRLLEFSDLLATAIVSIEDRAKLTEQATSDPLTGLANHRSLQRRLESEVARATRHGTALSVAVIDIDHFKQINDSAGHETGDDTLVRVADCLSRVARAEDMIGRTGGDEFAWILPETSREQALVAVDRARRMVAATMPRPYRVTVSAGICDTSVTQDPGQLIHLADGALYWSKAHGRNQCWIYDPTIVNELSARERAEKLERSQALVGLRALARAIDAKDPATRKHSERVSELVGKLARRIGWSLDRATSLSEAALVHDVGKIGVPDSVLCKPAPLTESEREQIRTHAELAARIVEDVLAPEQVEWIRTHHERPDGTGYPRGLRGSEISEGAALLAAADAWDVMTQSRSYSLPKRPDDALAECVDLIGRQFTKTAVEALVTLHAAGELVRREAVLEPTA
ncbi:MAG TPA: diguanylate cyclase [Solirubrobacteraceae bacterium]|jgi:diguanylate cyclase (GGDEF)-like protein